MTNQTGQTLDGVVDALLAVCQQVYSNPFNGQQVLVCEGEPDSYQPDLIVAVGMNVRQPVSRPTMGTARSRERVAEVDVMISTFVAGSGVAQGAARRQCTALTDLLEDYFRTRGNETLGDSCREAFVSNIDGPNPSVATDPQSGAITGRFAESTVTVTAYIRY